MHTFHIQNSEAVQKPLFLFNGAFSLPYFRALNGREMGKNQVLTLENVQYLHSFCLIRAFSYLVIFIITF